MYKRQAQARPVILSASPINDGGTLASLGRNGRLNEYAIALKGFAAGEQLPYACLLYTSDAADERSSVDLGGRRIIKKKKPRNILGSGGQIKKRTRSVRMNREKTTDKGAKEQTSEE